MQPDEIVKRFMDEFGDETKAITPAERKSAQRFIRATVKINPKSLDKPLDDLYADFTVLGKAIAGNELGTDVVTNWAKWKPGNASAAELLKPEGALKELLKQKNIVIKGVSRTKLDAVGSRLAEGLARGDSSEKMARDIRDIVASPRHALAIAQTEGARAQVMASRIDYENAGVKKFEWITADPCELCSDIEEEARGGVPFGYEFTLGDGITEPPAHPECRCDIVPVIESAFEPNED